MVDSTAITRLGVNFEFPGQECEVTAFTILDPNDAIVDYWPRLRPIIIDILRPLPWAVLSVLRGNYEHFDTESPYIRSQTYLSDHPIVIVGAPGASQGSWQAMADRVYAVCREAGVEHARVLFEDVLFPLTMVDIPVNSDPENPGGVPINAGDHKTNLPMGADFGPVGDGQPSASIGGTIKLQGENEEPVALLLSIFHLFAGMVNDGERLHGWRHGSGRAIELSVPSMGHVERQKNQRQGTIADLQQKVDRHYNHYQLTGDEKYRERAGIIEKILQIHLESLQTLVDDSNSSQGQLQYGSGFQRGFDWSLSLFGDREISNTPPTVEEFEWAFDKFRNRVDSPHPAYTPLDEITLTTAEANSYVMKRGRTTGLTIGQVNAIKSSMLLSNTLTMNGEICFEVHALTNADWDVLVLGGDSGAWVLDMDGGWIGSVIGCHRPEKGIGCKVAFVQDASKIVQDIEAFTGKKVVFPTRKDL